MKRIRPHKNSHRPINKRQTDVFVLWDLQLPINMKNKQKSNPKIALFELTGHARVNSSGLLGFHFFKLTTQKKGEISWCHDHRRLSQP